jgi:myo-inositol-1(or 4)-monophosphatase
MHKSTTISAMEKAALKAAKGIVRDFGELEQLQVSEKGPGDFVTSADIKAEQTIIEELQYFRPQYSILSEERGEIPGESPSKYRWIIDPIDGTTNFMHGIPLFCISIALEETKPNGSKEIISALVFAPITNEMFYAEKNQGAYCNGRRIRVSGRQHISSALFAAYPWHGRTQYANNPAIANKISNTTANVRVLGSSALDLAYVAAGKLDGFWHDSLKPWDMAASMLLIKEAHGIITDVKGGSDVLGSGTVLAANEILHGKLLTIINANKR